MRYFTLAIICLLLLTSFKTGLNQDSNKVYVTVLVLEDTTDYWCSTSDSYKVVFHPHDSSYKTRKVRNNAFSKQLKGKTDFKIRTIDFTMMTNEFVVVYEYALSPAPSCENNARIIKAFKIDDPANIGEKLVQRQKVSFVQDRILNTKVLETISGPQFAEPDLFRQLEQLLIEYLMEYEKNKKLTPEEKEKLKNIIDNRPTSHGVRG